MSKSKDIDIYSNGITRSSRECEERRTIGLELTKLQKKLVIKFHGEYIRHKNGWLAITYSHNSQVNTLPVPTKHVSSDQHIKIKNFDNEKKKTHFEKWGEIWEWRMDEKEWPFGHEEIGRRQCGGGVAAQRRRNPSEPPELSSFFFFFLGVQLQRLLLAVSSF